MLKHPLDLTNITTAAEQLPSISINEENLIQGFDLTDYLMYYEKKTCGNIELFLKDPLMEKYPFNNYMSEFICSILSH